jgi:uncharacterized membrane protein YccC
MTSYLDKFIALGFDLGRMRYAFRTAIGACIALAIGWAIGLEHPQWSAMTVWAASQPMRGHLLEKCLFRLGGTVIGTVVGVGLVLAMQVNPWLLVLGLSLWVALCTYVGNVQRGFLAYGALLSGYTAAMVSLLDSAHPDQVFLLGADRLATIALGVIVAALIGYFFTKYSATELLRVRVLSLYGDILRHVGHSQNSSEPDPQAGPALLEKLAGLDAELDQHAAGSPYRHRHVHALRSLLINGVSMVLASMNQTDATLTKFKDSDLDDIANAITGDELERAAQLLEQRLADNSPSTPPQGPFAILLETSQLLISAKQPQSKAKRSERTQSQIILHKDIRTARDAALRVGLCLIIFGAVWQLTGIDVLGFMLLGLAVMLSVFSNFENPALFMRHVVVGQIFGVIAALTCHWVLWPLATAEWQMIAMVIPFILFAPLLVGHRKTVFASFDYSMVSLLLLSPQFPLTGSFMLSLGQSLAVLSGPIIAIFAYRYVFPVSLSRRVDHLVHLMLSDIQRQASDEKALTRRTTWRARFYHRSLILLRQASASNRYRGKAHDINRAILTLGQLIMRCHAIKADVTLSQTQRDVAATILRLSCQIIDRPQMLADCLGQPEATLTEKDSQLLNKAREASQQLSILHAA